MDARSIGARARFNPRPPRGGRLARAVIDQRREAFQSTPPAWGATDVIALFTGWIEVSIHAPRVGGDPCA